MDAGLTNTGRFPSSARVNCGVSRTLRSTVPGWFRFSEYVPSTIQPSFFHVRSKATLARQLRGASYEGSNNRTDGAASLNDDGAPLAQVVGIAAAPVR